jgi:hypothetical protein
MVRLAAATKVYRRGRLQNSKLKHLVTRWIESMTILPTHRAAIGKYTHGPWFQRKQRNGGTSGSRAAKDDLRQMPFATAIVSFFKALISFQFLMWRSTLDGLIVRTPGNT